MTARIDKKALSWLRLAVHTHGYASESLAVDWCAEALVADGHERKDAERAAQKAWNQHFKAWGPI